MSKVSNTPDSPRWVCAEHGHVLTGAWRSNVEISVLHFCHVCGRELFRDDLLGEIERGGRQPVTFEEYVEAQGGL